MNFRVNRGLVGVAGVWALSILSSGCSDVSSEGAAATLAPSRGAGEAGLVSAQDAPLPHGTAFETNFMRNMIDHHAMGVDMAGVCLAKGVRPELHQLCLDISAAQSAEIATMQRWLREWYGVAHTPAARDTGELALLRGLSGAAFEREFMKTMARHHRVAVMDSRRAVEQAAHQQLIALAQRMHDSQLREIALMDRLLCDHFGECPAQPSPSPS
jgi:uncharacterized protein (DUF305 family)